jgi:hypothetical protein
MREKKSVVFMLRMTPDQLEHLQIQANTLGMNISEYLRLLVTADKNNNLQNKLRTT